jgi:hypothetical protein
MSDNTATTSVKHLWKRLTGMVLEVVAISQRLAPLKDGVVLEGGEHLRRIA